MSVWNFTIYKSSRQAFFIFWILEERSQDDWAKQTIRRKRRKNHRNWDWASSSVQRAPVSGKRLERYFHKEIARVQAQWYGQQSVKGIKHPVTSKHIRRLYQKKQNSVTDYLHKITRYFAKYCREQGITCVVAGDIRNIRKGKDLGHRTNQKFHNLPYNRLYSMMEYKLKMYGIRFVRQEESYTSQCSPLSPEVEKRYAQPCNRKQRGLYRDRNRKYNADAVGAYNILRKYLSVSGEKKELSVTGLKTPEIIKVAV